MRRRLTLQLYLLLTLMSFAGVCNSVERDQYANFFAEYQRLAAEFDSSISQLYENDAKITGLRKKPDGTEDKMTIDGVQWKSIIIASMEKARQVNDVSEYSNVTIAVDGDQAKISAKRYSLLKCYTDDSFYMTVKINNDDQIKIVEQFMESPAESNCKKTGTELADFLKSTVEMINPQLPAAVDAETQLIKTASNGNNLIYHYVLVNHTSQTLTPKVAEEKLAPIVVQQSCVSPNLRPILDQGGLLTYIYRGSDAVQIAKLNVDITACDK